MTISFSELWEEAEAILQDDIFISSSEGLIKEAQVKLEAYNFIKNNLSLSERDKSRLRAHTFGKILLVLTQLSSKDNVNVYTALKTSLDEVKINLLEAKYR